MDVRGFVDGLGGAVGGGVKGWGRRGGWGGERAMDGWMGMHRLGSESGAGGFFVGGWDFGLTCSIDMGLGGGGGLNGMFG